MKVSLRLLIGIPLCVLGFVLQIVFYEYFLSVLSYLIGFGFAMSWCLDTEKADKEGKYANSNL